MPYLLACFPELPEGDRLTSLAGFRRDLSIVLDYCQRLEEQIESPQPDHVTMDALGTAAAISYARCFTGGVRVALLREAAAGLPGELAEFHWRRLTLRDKYIAHSVNAMEENRLVVNLLMEKREAVAIDSIDVDDLRVQSIGWPDVPLLREVATFLLAAATAMFERERKRLRCVLGSMPLATLLDSRGHSLPEFLRAGSIGARRRRP